MRTDILDGLFQQGQISMEELVAVRETSQELGESVVRVLRALRVLDPLSIQEAFGKYHRIPVLEESQLSSLSASHAKLIPREIALHYSVFPLGMSQGRLLVAMEDPLQTGIHTELSFLLEVPILPVAATVYQLQSLLMNAYKAQAQELNLVTALERSRGVGIEVFGSEEQPQNDFQSLEPIVHEDAPSIAEQSAPEEVTSAEPLPPVSLPPQFQKVLNQALVGTALVTDREEALKRVSSLMSGVEGIVFEPIESKGVALGVGDQRVELMFEGDLDLSHPVTKPFAQLLKSLSRKTGQDAAVAQAESSEAVAVSEEPQPSAEIVTDAPVAEEIAPENV